MSVTANAPVDIAALRAQLGAYGTIGWQGDASAAGAVFSSDQFTDAEFRTAFDALGIAHS